MAMNQRYILAARPTGMPDEDHLKLEEAAMPEAGLVHAIVDGRGCAADGKSLLTQLGHQ